MINKKFRELVQTKSDISEHLPTLAKYASECRHITEFGVRTWLSTIALIKWMDRKAKMVSYDVYRDKALDEVSTLARYARKNWKFVIWDTQEIDIARTDMLFIDTLHNYDLLKVELERHAPKVRKYIIFHDTTTFWERWETEWHLWLNRAIHEYQQDHPERTTKEVFTNCNGLTVLERKGDSAKSDVNSAYDNTKKTPKPKNTIWAKVTVYTAIYWWIDILKKQPKQSIPVNFVCFTDDENLECEPGAKEQWEIIVTAPHKHLHPRMQAKYFRTHPYDYIDTEIVMYIDWTWLLLKKDSVEHFINQMYPKTDVLTFQHPARNCIVDEMEFCLSVQKYIGLPMQEQVERYLSKWYPKWYWLSATWLQITRKDNEKAKQFLRDRWTECLEWCYQDQLSYDYLVRNNGIKRQWVQDNQWYWYEYISYNSPHKHKN